MKGRLSTLTAAVLLLAGSAQVARAVPADSILVSGQMKIAIIDGNNDMMPGVGDCSFQATLAGGLLSILPVQDASTPLRACASPFTGTGGMGHDSSSDFLTAALTGGTGGELPLFAEFDDETPGTPDGPPLMLNGPQDKVLLTSLRNGASRGAGTLCDLGGPVANVTIANGTSLLMHLSLYPNAQNPTFLKVPMLPLEKAAPNLGSFVMRDAYVPVNANGTLTMALLSKPNEPLLIIDLGHLPLCGGVVRAPTTTEWGLIAAALSLLALGSWGLRRRPSFAQMLPGI